MPISGVGSRPLLLDNFKIAVRRTETAAPAIVSTSTPTSPTISRLQSLVEQIGERTLDSATSGGDVATLQSSVDRTLAEIRLLIGQTPPSAGSALLRGVDERQIRDVRVTSAPPGTAQPFSGTVSRARPASAEVAGAARVAQFGGQLKLNLGGRTETINVRPMSLAGLTRKINDQGLGVTAAIRAGRLHLTTNSAGRGSRFEVNARARRTVSQPGGTSVTGLNAAQIDAATASGLAAGERVTLSGTLDSVNSAATLEYRGDGSGLVDGTAAFRLSGVDGSTDVTITRGETLGVVAQRVNDRTAQTGVRAVVDGQTLRFESTDQGAESSITIDQVRPEFRRSVDGIHASQITSSELLAIPDGAVVTRQGTITRAAQTAQLTYVGDAAAVTDSASFTLQGDVGSASLDITAGESLAEVAARVNGLTDQTGVTASVDGDRLIFDGGQYGSNHSIRVTLDSVGQTVTVDGADPALIADFDVQSTTPDQSVAFELDIRQAAQRGTLEYKDKGGLVDGSVVFDLTGSVGTARLTALNGSSLQDLADDVNAVTDQTGVTAAIEQGKLVLQSVDYGESATVSVNARSGRFRTRGDGVGRDADVRADGQPLATVGNRVTYRQGLNDYDISLVPEREGKLDIVVSSAERTFDLQGGNAGGAAVGVDALLNLNGMSVTGSGNDFRIQNGGIDFAFSVASGFAGTLDPITLRSDADPFSIFGDDGNGTATGSDALATINGQTVVGVDGQFNLQIGGASFTLDFADGHLGVFDPVTFEEESTTSLGGWRSRVTAATGRDRVVRINDAVLAESGGRYVARSGETEASFEFADDFAGSFRDVTVSAAADLGDVSSPVEALNERDAAAVRTVLAELLELRTGGRFAVNAGDDSRTLRIATDAATRLRNRTAARLPTRRTLGGALFDRLV